MLLSQQKLQIHFLIYYILCHELCGFHEINNYLIECYGTEKRRIPILYVLWVHYCNQWFIITAIIITTIIDWQFSTQLRAQIINIYLDNMMYNNHFVSPLPDGGLHRTTLVSWPCRACSSRRLRESVRCGICGTPPPGTRTLRSERKVW